MKVIAAVAVCVALIAAALLALRGSANDPEPVTLASSALPPVYVCADGRQVADPGFCQPVIELQPPTQPAPVYVCADGSQVAAASECTAPTVQPASAPQRDAPVAGEPPCFRSPEEIAATIGGSPTNWALPTWEGGAWVYRGPSVTLAYPGFGWFDTWGGNGLHRDVFGSEVSFHCGDPLSRPAT